MEHGQYFVRAELQVDSGFSCRLKMYKSYSDKVSPDNTHLLFFMLSSRLLPLRSVCRCRPFSTEIVTSQYVVDFYHTDVAKAKVGARLSVVVVVAGWGVIALAVWASLALPLPLSCAPACSVCD